MRIATRLAAFLALACASAAFAQGEAQRFVSVYEEYAKAPDVTRTRLFIETMEQVLGQSEKVIVEPGTSGSGVVPYLPLPALQSGAR